MANASWRLAQGSKLMAVGLAGTGAGRPPHPPHPVDATRPAPTTTVGGDPEELGPWPTSN